MPAHEPAPSQQAPTPQGTVASTEAMEKAVVVVDLSRYSDIARELEQHVGAPAVRELNAQIQGFIRSALKVIGLAEYQLPYKNTGDGAIIALDTAEQASRFGEALHLAAQAHNLKKEVPLAQRHFRVGIWTDAIILNPQANAEGQSIGFEMAGTAVANAVRLEGACRTGEVLIGPDTWGDLPKAIRKQYGDQEEVKGKRGERFRAHRRKVVDAAPWEQTTGSVSVHPSKPVQSPSIENQPTASSAPPPQKSAASSVKPARPEPPTDGMRLTLLYKRGAQPDEQLLKCLEDEFTLHGHQVFVDRHLTIGVEWAKELECKIRGSDAVILLLSAASVQSEMLAYEVQIAHDEAQKRQGKPILLPVRVNYEGKLPAELASILDRLQYFLWSGTQDNARLLNELQNALQNPPAIKKIPPPAGVVPLDSSFYITRPTDETFLAAVTRQDSIVLLRGARQMGKTSLLARGLQQARKAGARIVMTDFQKLNASDLESIETLYRTLGEWIADELDLAVRPGDVWDPRRGPNVNFERYLRREILAKIDTALIWAMDEVDRLFLCPFGSEVFGLFRSWHNARVPEPTLAWSRLTLAIAYATEAHLFITDMNQSPFNVGTLLVLEDFMPEQVAELNRRYGSPLRTTGELEKFCQIIGGHPYLANRGLYEMVHHGLSCAAFQARADRDDGVFGDHLRRILILLAKDPELTEVVRGVLRGQPCASAKSFYRLRSAGVMTGDAARDARLRCQLYSRYLERQLL